MGEPFENPSFPIMEGCTRRAAGASPEKILTLGEGRGVGQTGGNGSTRKGHIKREPQKIGESGNGNSNQAYLNRKDATGRQRYWKDHDFGRNKMKIEIKDRYRKVSKKMGKTFGWETGAR